MGTPYWANVNFNISEFLQTLRNNQQPEYNAWCYLLPKVVRESKALESTTVFGTALLTEYNEVFHISLDTPSDQTKVLTFSQHHFVLMTSVNFGECYSLSLWELCSKFPSLFYSKFPSKAFKQLKAINKTEDFGL